MQIMNPTQLEMKINNIVGVVTNGLFADRGADVILIGTDTGVRTLDAHKFLEWLHAPVPGAMRIEYPA